MQEKLTGKERTALLYLAALDDEIHKASPILRERLREASPTGWRDWRLVQTTTARTLMQLVDTLPDKDVRWLSHMLEHGRMSITLPGPLAAPDCGCTGHGGHQPDGSTADVRAVHEGTQGSAGLQAAQMPPKHCAHAGRRHAAG